MLKERTLFEAAVVLIMTLVFGIFITMLGSYSLKFQIAFAIALFGIIAILLIPSRRTLCLCLWIIIQPLSIEKILYTGTPIWDNLRGDEIVINAADLILLMLLLITIFEHTVLNKTRYVWDKKTKLFTALLLWAAGSYLIHMGFYQSEFSHSGPLSLLHMFRNLMFVIIMAASIHSRGDLIWILVSIAAVLIIQSIFVSLSFATGEAFNFTRLLGAATNLQTYSAGGELVARATGTLGVSNQQAGFHAMFTFLLVGLFAVKNPVFRAFGLFAIIASMVAVLFTFSRSSWFSMAIASLLIAIIFVKRREVTPASWLIGGLVSLVFVCVLAVLAQPIIDRLTKGDDGATGSRVRMMMLAKDLTMQYPIIGVGPGSYAEAGLYLYPPGEKETEWVALGDKAIVPPLGRVELATYITPGQKPLLVPLGVHNKYLLTLSELGIVGLVIWLWIFYNFFIEAKKCSTSRDPLLRFIGVGGIGAVLVVVIYMNLDLFATDKTLQVVLFPLIFISAAYRISQQNKIASEGVNG